MQTKREVSQIIYILAPHREDIVNPKSYIKDRNRRKTEAHAGAEHEEILVTETLQYVMPRGIARGQIGAFLYHLQPAAANHQIGAE